MEDRVLDIDRIEGGVIITFLDGIIVRYSAALLRQMIPQAEVLPHESDPEPED